MSSKILVIAGMHRSGTSLISQYLGECGLDIGDKLHSTDTSNQNSAFDGHHEDKEFMKFHREILYKKHLYFPTTELRLPIKINNKYRQKALQLVDSRKHKDLWGWKDPETTLFLNFWHDILENPRYLFLFRHPLAVVDSLIRRQTDTKIVSDPIKGLRVWNVYNRQILNFYYQHQDSCLIVEIDRLIQNPHQLLDGLKNKFNIELNYLPFEKVFTKQAFRSQYSELVKNLANPIYEEFEESLRIYEELLNITTGKNFGEISVLNSVQNYSIANQIIELEDYLWQRPKLNRIFRNFQKYFSQLKKDKLVNY